LLRHQIQLAAIAIFPHRKKFTKKKAKIREISLGEIFSMVNFKILCTFLRQKRGFLRFFNALEKFSPD